MYIYCSLPLKAIKSQCSHSKSLEMLGRDTQKHAHTAKHQQTYGIYGQTAPSGPFSLKFLLLDEVGHGIGRPALRSDPRPMNVKRPHRLIRVGRLHLGDVVARDFRCPAALESDSMLPACR